MNWLKENKFSIFLLLCIIALFAGGSYALENINMMIYGHKYAIQDLEKEVKRLSDNDKELENTTIAPLKTSQPIQTKTTIDPQVQIESCKAHAKLTADNIARREYLQAYEGYLKNGMSEEAALMLEASYGPKHPANYDENYQKEYIKCLNN